MIRRDARQIKYLAGLEARKKEHRALLTAYPDAYFYRHPLGEPGYWGVPCQVVFKHQGKQVVHRGVDRYQDADGRRCTQKR